MRTVSVAPSATSPATRRRAGAALQVLREQPGVDPARLAAIGYCFGGMSVLELARDGANLAGIVSFHGGYDIPLPASKGDIHARILICHGAADRRSWAHMMTFFSEVFAK